MKKFIRNKIISPLFRGFSGYTTGIFLLSMLLGSVFTYFFSQYDNRNALSIFEATTKQIPHLAIASSDITIYSLKQNLQSYLLLFFFAFTNVFRIYHFFFTTCTGLRYGVLFEFCILTFGLEGFLIFLCCCTPHCIILATIYLNSAGHLKTLHHDFFHTGSATTRHSFFLSPQKRQLCFKQLPFLIINILFLLLASITEGYLNLLLLQTCFSNQ